MHTHIIFILKPHLFTEPCYLFYLYLIFCSILTYEQRLNMWTEKDDSKLQVAEMKFLWTIKKRAHTLLNFIFILVKLRIEWYGHVLYTDDKWYQTGQVLFNHVQKLEYLSILQPLHQILTHLNLLVIIVIQELYEVNCLWYKHICINYWQTDPHQSRLLQHCSCTHLFKVPARARCTSHIQFVNRSPG
jgi:hypothetical protein